MPKKKLPTPRERLFSIYRLANKPRYVGDIFAKDAAAAVEKAKTAPDLRLRPADHSRLIAR